MRWIARHRKLLNRIVIVVCMVVFVYLIILTKQRIDVDVDSQVYSGIAMGTAIKKTIYSEETAQSEAADKVIDECLKNLENQISVRLETSEISKLNRNYAVDGVYELPDHILSYLEQELQVYKETDGAFSPCILPISTLWGIEDGSTTIPDAISIQSTLQYINADNIELVENGIIFHKDYMSVDLGASGKGIACDEVRQELAKTNIQGAVISIGGSILAYGDKGDGKEWHIGIRDPKAGEGEVLGVVDVKGNTVISTSGDYEKYFELDGKRYHHIFDPSTGYPADSGLISVTIICENGLLSDAMSTACFVMGLDAGMQYVNEKGVDAVFVTSDQEVYITKGIRKAFRLQTEEYKLTVWRE